MHFYRKNLCIIFDSTTADNIKDIKNIHQILHFYENQPHAPTDRDLPWMWPHSASRSNRFVRIASQSVNHRDTYHSVQTFFCCSGLSWLFRNIWVYLCCVVGSIGFYEKTRATFNTSFTYLIPCIHSLKLAVSNLHFIFTQFRLRCFRLMYTVLLQSASV